MDDGPGIEEADTEEQWEIHRTKSKRGPECAKECCSCTQKIIGIFQAGLLENSKEENQDKYQ